MLEFDLDHDNPRRNKMRKMTLAALLAAAAVLLSPLSFPLGPSRCFPFQHAVNAVAGVILGPFWAFGSALVASFVRNVLGTGTLLAFPGSLFGALSVGFAAKMLRAQQRHLAAFAEPVATATLGAWVASLIASTSGGRGAMFSMLAVAFLASSVPGAFIGYFLLRGLKRRRR